MYAQADVVVASRTDDQRRNNETTAGAQKWHNERKTCKSLKIPASPREVETAARRTWSVYGQTTQTKIYPSSPHVCMLEAPEQQRMKRTQLGSRWLYNRRLRGTRTTKGESHVKTMCVVLGGLKTHLGHLDSSLSNGRLCVNMVYSTTPQLHASALKPSYPWRQTIATRQKRRRRRHRECNGRTTTKMRTEAENSDENRK